MNIATIPSERFWQLPEEFAVVRASAWGQVNMRGHALSSFLEGPCFDRDQNLHVVDVPFGRIFQVKPDGTCQLCCEYEGWPNGLKINRDGALVIADYRLGILVLDKDASQPRPLVTTFRSAGFLGCNDLFFSPDGDLWFTDQGQTGLHHPAGSVFRLDADGRLACVLDNIPSPNGLVMNAAQTQLYVAVTRANAVWRLPLMEDGTTSKVGLYIQLSGGLAGPDGLAMDVEGGLVVAHPGIGIWRYDRVGRPTHLIESPQGVMWTNIAYGGDDNRSLHMTDSANGCVDVSTMPYPGERLFAPLP